MAVNKKILKWSTILSVLSAYVLPGRASSKYTFNYGYPFGFFEIRDNSLNSGNIILSSTALDLFILGLDILIIYLIIYSVSKKILLRKNKSNTY